MSTAITTSTQGAAWTGDHGPQNEFAHPGGNPGRARGNGDEGPRKQDSASIDPAHSHSTGLAGPLLARLDGVRPAGAGKWYARCPAHDDRSPSLSIREDRDRVLIHCFAGCDPTDVLTAVGIAWRDLYPDRWDCARLRPNEAAARYVRRTLAALDPMDLERRVLAIAAADLRAGKPLSAEDRARIEVARDRLAADRGSVAS